MNFMPGVQINYWKLKLSLGLFLFLTILNLDAQNLQQKVSSSNFSVKEAIIKKVEKITSFSADFNQTKKMEMLDKEQESRGKIYYQSPDLLKWEYTAPMKQELLFKDKMLYVTENGKTSTHDLGSNDLFGKLTALISGSFNGKLLTSEKDFEVTYHPKLGATHVLIVPKDSRLRSMFEEIWIQFDSDHLMKEIKLIDGGGDATTITFQNVQTNRDIPPSIFKK